MKWWPFSKKRGGRKRRIEYRYIVSGNRLTPYDEEKDLDERLRAVEQTIDSHEPQEHDHQRHTDENRARIALFFVKAFAGLIFFVLLAVPLYNWLALSSPQAIEIDKTLAQVAGILGTPLGFIVGYYFEKGDKN